MNRRKFLATVSTVSLMLVIGCTPNEKKSNPISDSPGSNDKKLQGYWTCSMHPQIHRDGPGQCPICGMPLIHVKSEGQLEKKETAYIEPSNEQLNNARIGKYTVVKKDFIISLPVSGRMVSSQEVAFQIYESDLEVVKTGIEFFGFAASSPREFLKGHISRIDNMVDPSSRTIRAIGRLQTRPSVFISESGFHGEIKNTIKNQICVPEDAVLRAGTRDLVYVFSTSNRLEARQVKLGQKGNKEYQILSGLHEGEIISTGANFLIDSEAKIRGQ